MVTITPKQKAKTILIHRWSRDNFRKQIRNRRRQQTTLSRLRTKMMTVNRRNSLVSILLCQRKKKLLRSKHTSHHRHPNSLVHTCSSVPQPLVRIPRLAVSSVHTCSRDEAKRLDYPTPRARASLDRLVRTFSRNATKVTTPTRKPRHPSNRPLVAPPLHPPRGSRSESSRRLSRAYLILIFQCNKGSKRKSGGKRSDLRRRLWHGTMRRPVN
mmetsp:Transcript_22223/g.51262  ORF Transcript_22223/g.51262 Transcript_22223/m.51262 type:complete len:213 (+) Transcript_22223:692-1330(+)